MGTFCLKPELSEYLTIAPLHRLLCCKKRPNSKYIEQKSILTSIKGHDSVTNKLNIDLINLNAFTKFRKILSYLDPDIAREQTNGINQGPQLW